MKKKIIIIVVLIFVFLIWFCKSFMVVKDENGNVKYQGNLVQSAESTTEIITNAGEASSVIQEDTTEEATTEATTEVTYGFNNPAPLGVAQTVSTSGLSGDYTAEIKIVSTVRGQEALNIIMSENSLNEAPEDGYEYILARVNFKNVKCDEGKSVNINPYAFDAFTADGTSYDAFDSLGIVIPDELKGEIYQGAEKEGNLLFTTKIGDHPKISYGTSYDGTGGIWFKLD